jgi:hypothetical protein
VRAPIGGRAINHTPPYAPTAMESTAGAISPPPKPIDTGSTQSPPLYATRPGVAPQPTVPAWWCSLSSSWARPACSALAVCLAAPRFLTRASDDSNASINDTCDRATR